MKPNTTYKIKTEGHRLTVENRHQPGSRRHVRNLLRTAALAALLLTSVGLKAADYVLTYTNGGTTYFLARNVTSGVQRVTTFNPTTCIWSCASNTAGTTAGTLNNSNTYGYLFQTVNGTRYFLNASADALGLGTNAGANNYYRWRTNGTYVYNRYSGTYSYYINLANGVARNTTANTASNARPYEVTVDDLVQGFSDFEITGGESSFNATGSSTYGHTNTTFCDQSYTHYSFNGNNYYVNASNESTGTNPVATVTNAANYTWSLSDNADGYATVNSSGVVTVTAIPTSGNTTITLTCTVTYNNQTATATKSITLTQTGVSGGTVTLDDREDHNWSYYRDPACPIRSLNPADVTITYYGNGTGTVQTNNNDTPSTWGANATKVKVGIDADASTFVYYKTLERNNGRGALSTAAANGRCAYTTIANPFSVRPTYDSDATSKYRGFYAWRIKSLSGGSIHSAATGGTSYAVGDTINAETEVFFAPDSEYGMDVQMEALWARAYVSTSGAGNRNLGVERNFYVITASANTNITAGNYPCTYTSIYPNGTTDGTNTANGVTVYKYGGFTASADSKIEYIILRNNNTSTVNANGKNFTIGRGVTGYNGGLCATNLYGLNGNATTSFHFNFASGRFTNLYFCGDGNSMTSGKITSVIGCDYDRATEDNSKLKITSDIIAGHNGNGGSDGNEGEDFLCCTVKSGDFDLGDYGGGVQFYLSLWGNTGSGTYGKKTMIIEGGVFSDISGGIDVNDTQVAAVDMVEIRMKGGTVNGALYGAAQYAASYGNRYIIITGGDLKGWIAGGANGTQTTGGKLTGDTYVYFGGNAKCDSNGSSTTMGNGKATGGNIFGAGSGNSAADAGEPVGEVNNSTVVIADNSFIERSVYGGGNYGYVAKGTGHKSDIHIIGGTINGSVFGGSNNQDGQIVNLLMTKGFVGKGIYGGSNVTGVVAGPVTMNINGGQVGTSSQTANIHGGGYGAPTRVNGNVEITLGVSGQTTPGVTVYGDVYGGSALGHVNGGENGTTASNTYHTYVTMNAGTINGSLYGGGLGATGTAANVYGPVAVTVNGGSVKTTSADGSGAVYGCNNISGAPQRAVTVDIYGTDPAPSATTYALDAVYGGGNKASYTYTTTNNIYPKVTVHNCDNSIGYVYGGGNAADVPATDVTIYGGNKIGNVFGGGNGTNGAANVSGNTNVKIYGGTILKVFGGSNSAGTIGGTINVTAESQAETSGDTPCRMQVDELYGGGNMASSNVGNITIGCMNDGDIINYVYGGSNDADITGDITLTMTGGRVEHLFGGNNIGHSISGDIEVNVDWATGASACPDSYLGYVYGAGNKANFDHNTTVNIKNGIVTHDVFGGGLEAAVAGNVAVNVTGGAVLGSLYGGGALANTNTGSNKTTTVTLSGGTVNDVYGGGLGQKDGFFGATSDIPAYVNGNVLVELNGSTETGATNDCVVTGNIFGCNNLNGTPKGTVTVHIYKTQGNGSTKVRTAAANLDNPTESDHTYELAAVYGGGNMAAYVPTDATNGKTVVIIDGCDETSIEYVYGGGNAASVPATDVIINGTYEIGYVFGGGNGRDDLPNGDSNPGADVGIVNGSNYGSGESLVTILGGTVHNAFGGSNSRGNIRTSATVNLDEAKDSNDNVICPLKVDEVYGGGNEALMYGGGNIVLGCITYLHEIYGGAKQADVGSSVSLTITSGHFDRVFGGNNLGGCIKGSITVNIEETGCNPITIGELYGCGNKAAYSIYGYEADGTVKTSGDNPYADPTLNIKSFTSIGRVFGGGLGTKAVVVGNPTVNVNEIIGANASAASSYAGTTRTLSDGSTVTLPAHTAGEMGVIGEVFGGGNAANVVGDTYVNIGTETTVTLVSGSDHSAKTVEGANITGNVYGGGNAADVTGKTNVTIGQP